MADMTREQIYHGYACAALQGLLASGIPCLTLDRDDPDGVQQGRNCDYAAAMASIIASGMTSEHYDFMEEVGAS